MIVEYFQMGVGLGLLFFAFLAGVLSVIAVPVAILFLIGLAIAVCFDLVAMLRRRFK